MFDLVVLGLIARVFTPSVGIGHEWNMSSAVTIIQVGDSTGVTTQ